MAVKLAVVAPEETVTDPGTVRLVLFEESATAVPPLGAAALTVTVQVEVPGALMDVGVHVKELTVGGGGATGAVIVPPAPVSASVEPVASDPSVLLTFIVVLLTVEAIVTLTTATTPLAMVFVFIPVSTHV